MPNILTYGTDHKFPINTNKIVTASFGSSPQNKPGGAKAIHINADSQLHALTHQKGRLLNKMGDLAVPHIPINDLHQRSGFDYNVIHDAFGQAQFRDMKSTTDINNVMDFVQLVEGYGTRQFDPHGTFTKKYEDVHRVAVCPSLGTEGILSVDGKGVTEEELNLVTEMIEKFALDYFVLSMVTSALGVKAADLNTILLPAAFSMVEEMIKVKIK